MSIKTTQYSDFWNEVRNHQHVFTFLDTGYFVIIKVDDQDAIPFWSSRQRVEEIQRTNSGYARLSISKMSLNSFSNCLTDCATHGISIGINWSGNDGLIIAAEAVKALLAPTK